jgi:hypothetical protein
MSEIDWKIKTGKPMIVLKNIKIKHVGSFFN